MEMKGNFLSALTGLVLACSTPQDEGRCEYNEFGDCVQTFQSHDGKTRLEVTYAYGVRGKLVISQRVRHDPMTKDGCRYEIEHGIFGVRLIDASEQCESSNLESQLPALFLSERDRALNRN